MYSPQPDFRCPLDAEDEPEYEDGNLSKPVDAEKVAVATLFKPSRHAPAPWPSDLNLQRYEVPRRGGTIELTARGRDQDRALVEQPALGF
jgi:hypothetical protein